MSRHIDPGDHSFRRSLLRAAAGGLAALAVTAAATALLTRLGRDDGTGGPAVVLTDAATPAPATTLEAPSPSPEPEATTPAPAPEPTEPTERATPAELTEEPNGTVTVQVLYNGGSSDLAEEAAAALRELGYDVVAVNGTQHTVEETTVFASPGSRDAAEALREADPRFRLVEENTVFVPEVNLHVILGPEFAAG